MIAFTFKYFKDKQFYFIEDMRPNKMTRTQQHKIN